ncbi:MAG: circularly permuted type 2 ATP-grasp protein, partial [Actinomycetes bacterium]
AAGAGPAAGYDEFAAPDGTVRPGWLPLMKGLDAFAETDLRQAQREVARLLEDDAVSYTPSPAATTSILDPPAAPPAAAAPPHPLAEPRRWELDPVPLVLEDREWSRLEAGLVQRAELLDAILADLYSTQQLLARRHLPPAAVFAHEEYLRPLVGVDPTTRQRLFLTGVDLGRDASGGWKVIADRTQAPSGAGYAMQNRRVVSRVLPEIYHAAHLHRLTPFFHAMRAALLEAAPQQAEDPRVVVLSPGTHSETAFDQAFVASLLGFPLLEGRDLTVRDGRVWMRVLGKLEQVDVILRRIDAAWTDPLELRPRSRLGVAGLVECVRQGTVSVVNTLGSGILENPALLPALPDLCVRLLGEPLRLPSVDTWWCGDPAGLDHVLSSLSQLVIRPISREAGRSVVGAALSAAERETLTAKITATPHRYVGQEMLTLSSAPTSVPDRLVRRTVRLRAFAVRSGSSYTAMLGGLARVSDHRTADRGVLVTTAGDALAKDVWVVGTAPLVEPPTVPRVRSESDLPAGHPAAASAAMVPRVLSDLYWFGRYAERAEDLVRLLLATRTVALETDLDVSSGHALGVLLQAITHVSTTYPGFLAEGVAIWPELRALVLD